MPDERELRDYLLPFLDVDDPIVIRMRHEPDPASARLLVSLGAGWIVEDSAPRCVRACGQWECQVRDLSAHEVTRTVLCAQPLCAEDARNGSDFCSAHQPKVKVAARRSSGPVAASPENPYALKTAGKGFAWTRETIIAAMRAFATEHGRPPVRTDWQISGGAFWPSFSTVYRICGSFAKAADEAVAGTVLEEAGRERLGPVVPASSSTDLPKARLRVVQRIAAVREEIDAMERELLDALEDEAA